MNGDYPAGVSDSHPFFQEPKHDYDEWLASDWHFEIFENHYEEATDEIGAEAIGLIVELYDLYKNERGFDARHPIYKAYLAMYDLFIDSPKGSEIMGEYFERYCEDN